MEKQKNVSTNEELQKRNKIENVFISYLILNDKYLSESWINFIEYILHNSNVKDEYIVTQDGGSFNIGNLTS